MRVDRYHGELPRFTKAERREVQNYEDRDRGWVTFDRHHNGDTRFKRNGARKPRKVQRESIRATIAQQVAEDTCQQHGEFLCPKCFDFTVV